MDVKKILIFGLFIVPVFTSQCFNESELEEAADRRLRKYFHQPLKPSDTASMTETPASCPVELYLNNPPKNISGRSLSPWRVVIRTNNDHFPSTYYEAECLCDGCILMDTNPEAKKRLIMTDDYNSVPIVQSKTFLKKEVCQDNPQKYSLKTVYVKVAVGCTCARPNLS